jgi:hypothetical protein
MTSENDPSVIHILEKAKSLVDADDFPLILPDFGQPWSDAVKDTLGPIGIVDDAAHAVSVVEHLLLTTVPAMTGSRTQRKKQNSCHVRIRIKESDTKCEGK